MMAREAHTPGPWATYDADPLVIVNSEGSSLGEMTPGDPFITPGAAIANALLAAASPDLLSIAERWAALDSGSWHPDRHAADKAQLLADTRAAIAKAKLGE